MEIDIFRFLLNVVAGVVAGVSAFMAGIEIMGLFKELNPAYLLFIAFNGLVVFFAIVLVGGWIFVLAVICLALGIMLGLYDW